jgi:hypothetical protein
MHDQRYAATRGPSLSSGLRADNAGGGGGGRDGVVAVGVPPKISMKPKGFTTCFNCVMRV